MNILNPKRKTYTDKLKNGDVIGKWTVKIITT